MTDLARLFVAVACALFAIAVHAEGSGRAAINLTPGPVVTQELLDAVVAADAALFEAAFNGCDVDALSGMVAEDLEFLHDKSGEVASSGPQFVDSVREMCAGRREGRIFPARRELVPASMQVYPLDGYGAIQIGMHRFYALVDGEPDRLTETGRFTHVWRHVDGSWLLARVLSYDHVLAR